CEASSNGMQLRTWESRDSGSGLSPFALRATADKSDHPGMTCQPSKLELSINPLETTMGANGRTLLYPGTAHALPRRTQPVVRLVVDGGPSAARGDSCADAERRRAVARGEPAGRGPDRARPVPFLQPPRHVPAAVHRRDDRRLLHVAAPGPPQR